MSPFTWALLALALLGAEPDDGLSQVPCAFAPAFFETGTARLAGNWAATIDRGYLADFEAFSPASRARIRLMGIAADGRSARANRRLARRRAETVRDFLVARGVARDRIEIVTSDPSLAQWPLDSTQGRAVVMDVWIATDVLTRRMPPGGPIC